MVSYFDIELQNDNNIHPINIKERKLKFGIHNSWNFIGMENSVSLSKKDHILIFKGVAPMERFFYHDCCAFIFEIVYTRIYL
jgi:hypothetical protein